MGLTLVPVPHASDNLRIKVVETSVPHLCGTTITLRQFAQGCKLHLTVYHLPELGEYRAEYPLHGHTEFIQGPEVPTP